MKKVFILAVVGLISIWTIGCYTVVGLPNMTVTDENGYTYERTTEPSGDEGGYVGEEILYEGYYSPDYYGDGYGHYYARPWWLDIPTVSGNSADASNYVPSVSKARNNDSGRKPGGERQPAHTPETSEPVSLPRPTANSGDNNPPASTAGNSTESVKPNSGNQDSGTRRGDSDRPSSRNNDGSRNDNSSRRR